jgi:hypothetical protein
MAGTSGTGGAEARGDDGELDPRAAALLLAQTQRQTQRALDFRSPWLSLLAAAVALAAFGAIWLSVRGQHPYRGPTPAGLVVLYALVALRIGTFLYAYRRATAGVSGGSVRRQRREGAAVAAALIAVYLAMVPLAVAGAPDGVVYGVYVSTATLVVLGLFGAAHSAVRADRPGLGLSAAIILVAAGSAFAGPRGVWLSDGVGCCVALAGYSAVQAWLLRGPRSGTDGRHA